nr:AMP-binding protein [Actinomadura decatromicini]
MLPPPLTLPPPSTPGTPTTLGDRPTPADPGSSGSPASPGGHSGSVGPRVPEGRLSPGGRSLSGDVSVAGSSAADDSVAAVGDDSVLGAGSVAASSVPSSRPAGPGEQAIAGGLAEGGRPAGSRGDGVVGSSGGGSVPDVDLSTSRPDRDVALVAWGRGEQGRAGDVVRLTHAEVVAGLVRVADSGLLGGSDVVLSALPFSDVLGVNGVLNPALRLGATVVACAGTRRPDLLRALRDHQVTVAVLPPRLVEALAYDRAVSRYELGALRAVVAAGGPLAAEDARAAAARLGCPVRQAYGLAEAAGFTHLNLRAVEEGTLDSVGRGLPGVTWRIVHPRRGTAQPSYQPGELCVRLPVARTAAVPVRWLPTGDSAFADDHERVFILGRLPAVRSEPPGEPEPVLAAHPAVEDAVVAPAPDDDLGLAPHAFVVLAERASEDDLLAYVNKHVHRTRMVSAVHVVDEIPRAPDGQVRRRALLERAGLAP